MVMLCEGTLKKQHFGLMVSYYGGYIVMLSWMHKTQCVLPEEARGLWVSDILLSHHWRSWSRRTSQECSWKETFFGIMVSSHISRPNKSFSVIDFYPSFHSSPTYNYPSVSKGGPCHPRLWQCSRRRDMTNGKSTNSQSTNWMFESIDLILADQI